MTTELRRILIVDDDADDRTIYRRLLADAGEDFDVLEADCGLAGLACIVDEPFDCILLDYNLPDQNGLEFLAALQNAARRSTAPVVMLTGQGDEIIAAQAIKSGAADCLSKDGLTSQQLVHTIESAVERATLRREVEQLRRRLVQSNRELKEAKDTAEAANRAKSEFVANMSQGVSESINWAAALEAAGEDADLLASLVEIFLGEGPQLMDQIRTALAAGDAKQLALSAHTLKGAVRVFGQEDSHVDRLAFELEQAGRTAQKSGDDLGGGLNRAADALAEHLDKMLGELLERYSA